MHIFEIYSSFLKSLPLWAVLLLCFLPTYTSWTKQGRFTIPFLILGGIFFATLEFLPYTFPVILGMHIFTYFFQHYHMPSAHYFQKYSLMTFFIWHPLYAVLAYLFYGIFKAMPTSWASYLGGQLGEFLGRVLKKPTKIALRNLQYALPEDADKHEEYVREMWNVFGRTVAETPHLKHLYRRRSKYITFKGTEYIDQLKGKPFCVFIAHYTSPSLPTFAFAERNMATGVMYRAPNNPLMDPMIKASFSDAVADITFLNKGPAGIRMAMKLLAQGKAVNITPDQYYGNGEKLSFFGKPAMTSTVLPKLAAHTGCPIIPIQVIRTKGLKHTIIYHKPFTVSGKDAAAQTKAAQKINDITEGWVREHPGQWLWAHTRWGKGI